MADMDHRLDAIEEKLDRIYQLINDFNENQKK